VTTTLLIQNGDWVRDGSTGRPKTIADGDKLSQDLNEAFAIAVQPNGYGLGIDDIVGSVPASPTAFALDVQLRIARGISRLIGLQRQDRFNQRPLNERIVRIERFSAHPYLVAGASTTDPTALYVSLSVRTAANRGSVVTGVLRP